MITNVLETSFRYQSESSEDQNKTEVDDIFISMLKERFDNDDIRDPIQDNKDKSIGDMMNIKSMMGIDSGDGAITLDDMSQVVERDLCSFRSMLDIALNEAGISKDPAFEVKSDGAGRLYIDSDHPDKEAIEKILNETPNIESAFKRASGASSLIAAGKRALQFQKAYELDPQSAVQRYSYLFNEEPCDAFSIFVSEDGYKPSLVSYGENEDLQAFDNFQNQQAAAGGDE